MGRKSKTGKKKMKAVPVTASASEKRKKLIRLDDLIPKKDVAGGRQVLFGARDSGNGTTDDRSGR